MKRLHGGVLVLEGFRMSCIYALAVDGGVVLIDSGAPGAAARILAQLEAAGYAPGDLRAIVLTHAHVDHTGNAARLAALSGAEVLAFRGEVSYVEGMQPLPYRSRVQRLAMDMGDGRLSHVGACKVTRALDDGEVLEDLGGLQVLHTPGHTPGSICLYRPEGQVLFSGDLLVHSRRGLGRRAVRYSLPQFSVDPAVAAVSARKLLALPIEVLCCGHGEPIVEDADAQIRALVRF